LTTFRGAQCCSAAARAFAALDREVLLAAVRESRSLVVISGSDT
jgi:hypothetical protein